MQIDIELKPEETDLTGDWIEVNNRIVGDPVTQRIKLLVANYLEKMTTDWSGWDTLYKDPKDGRYWELTYPKSWMQGGGPPRLTNFPPGQVREKYPEVLHEK